MTDTSEIGELIRTEFSNVPLEHWGYFFPCHVAVWRYIEARYPGVVGPLRAGYSGEPWFEGTGAHWFCGVLGENPQYLDAVEALSYFVVNHLPDRARVRGSAERREIPQLPEPVLTDLVAAIEHEVGKLKAES
jgi:hypothetical protein